MGDSDAPLKCSVYERMAEAMTACIQEMETVEQPIVDLLLTHLLASNKAENPSSYKLASMVVQQGTVTLDTALPNFFNDVLGVSQPHEAGESEVADQAYPLLFELHRLRPSLLISVIPGICEHLEAEQLEMRLAAVKMLGQLFSSDVIDYATELPRQFKQYLGRFHDASSKVQAEMVQYAGILMKAKPALIGQLEGGRLFLVEMSCLV